MDFNQYRLVDNNDRRDAHGGFHPERLIGIRRRSNFTGDSGVPLQEVFRRCSPVVAGRNGSCPGSDKQRQFCLTKCHFFHRLSIPG